MATRLKRKRQKYVPVKFGRVWTVVRRSRVGQYRLATFTTKAKAMKDVRRRHLPGNQGVQHLVQEEEAFIMGKRCLVVVYSRLEALD